MAIQYKRILLKVSGEALSGPKGTGFDEETIASICAGIKAAHDLGAQIGIVVGGGNFWRGRSSGKMDRMDADKIGMLATVMNALAVKDALRQQGVDAVVMTSSFMPQVAECFTSDKAIAALESDRRVRRRHRQPDLLHRHSLRPARAGDRRGRYVQGHDGRRRL